MTPIITSLLDTDLYKFTMWQAMLHRHPQTQSLYRFVCRTQTAFPMAELVDEVRAEIDQLCQLKFRKDELDYLASWRFMKSDFIDFLRIFQFQRDFIEVRADGEHLHIVASGPQVHVMGFEIFVLSIVNELYFRRFDQQAALTEGRRRLAAKVVRLQELAREAKHRHPFELFDFGVRRRFSGAWQREVVQTFATQTAQWFKGTSNVLLARDLGLVPIGTMAHEYLQSYQAHGVRLRDFQIAALIGRDAAEQDVVVAALDDVNRIDLHVAQMFDGGLRGFGAGTEGLALVEPLGVEPEATSQGQWNGERRCAHCTDPVGRVLIILPENAPAPKRTGVSL